jgi:hypothetical protein
VGSWDKGEQGEVDPWELSWWGHWSLVIVRGSQKAAVDRRGSGAWMAVVGPGLGPGSGQRKQQKKGCLLRFPTEDIAERRGVMETKGKGATAAEAHWATEAGLVVAGEGKEEAMVEGVEMGSPFRRTQRC